jgi:hypothetical protein
MSDDVTMTRLDDQIVWYDRRSGVNQSSHKVLRLIVIVLSALIPVLAGVHAPSWILAALGASITIIEGVQQLNEYQKNWISYRLTCEALKDEKYLYLAKAGPYATAVDAHALLAERVSAELRRSMAEVRSAGSRQVGKTGEP